MATTRIRVRRLNADTTRDSRNVARAGDTLTGALSLAGDPTAAAHAARKAYVDDSIADGADAMLVPPQAPLASPLLVQDYASIVNPHLWSYLDSAERAVVAARTGELDASVQLQRMIQDAASTKRIAIHPPGLTMASQLGGLTSAVQMRGDGKGQTEIRRPRPPWINYSLAGISGTLPRRVNVGCWLFAYQGTTPVADLGYVAAWTAGTAGGPDDRAIVFESYAAGWPPGADRMRIYVAKLGTRHDYIGYVETTATNFAYVRNLTVGGGGFNLTAGKPPVLDLQWLLKLYQVDAPNNEVSNANDVRDMMLSGLWPDTGQGIRLSPGTLLLARGRNGTVGFTSGLQLEGCAQAGFWTGGDETGNACSAGVHHDLSAMRQQYPLWLDNNVCDSRFYACDFGLGYQGARIQDFPAGLNFDSCYFFANDEANLYLDDVVDVKFVGAVFGSSGKDGVQIAGNSHALQFAACTWRSNNLRADGGAHIAVVDSERKAVQITGLARSTLGLRDPPVTGPVTVRVDHVIAFRDGAGAGTASIAIEGSARDPATDALDYSVAYASDNAALRISCSNAREVPLPGPYADDAAAAAAGVAVSAQYLSTAGTVRWRVS